MRLIALTLVTVALLQAHDPITTKITFSREIVRLFQKRCFSCHQEGGKAMSLVKYDEARPWAKAIKEEVLERRMPPWGAVKGFGEFANDRALTQEEISIITDWVEGGAPEGELKYLPENPLPDPFKPVRLSGTRLTLQSSIQLRTATRLIGIEPRAKGDIRSVRVVAESPDGAVEPLLWLRQYKGEWNQVFTFRKPIQLPAGAMIRVEPPLPSGFILYTRK